ncbi:MAG: molybdopterin-guanine dinucleotide biosynthesis protein B [Deltaproteobacteria bacterium]|nr:molybdopterin-guanine dinucleotide biosynthesis protein B [Deltaproteobacteria bacterium]
MADLPRVVSFVGRSGTGKTTFLEGLVRVLSARGLRLLLVKHDVHGFQMDQPGKDSYRLKQAGANRVLLANAQSLALIADCDGDAPLLDLVERYGAETDLVLSEGYRRSGMPKILVDREGAPSHLPPEDVEQLVAVVSDRRLDVALPHFPLNEPEPCAEFLLEHYVGATAALRETSLVLLAGGHSVRMGRDKAFLEFQGQPLLSNLVERLSPVFSGRVLVVRRPGQELPQLPSEAQIMDDLLPEHAALGGLYSGLALARTPFVFVAACDMPLLDPDFVRWLLSQGSRSSDAVIPVRDGYLEPTHAVYGHRCLGAIKQALLSGEFRMDGWLGSVRVARIDEALWSTVHPGGHSFVNANSEEDLLRAESLAHQETRPL